MRISSSACRISQRILLLAILALPNFVRDSHSQSEATWLNANRVKEIMAEADAACAELIKYDETNKKSAFSLTSSVTLGKLADAYMRRGQLDQARKLLKLMFDPMTADFLVATTAVQFGAPIPKLDRFADVNEEYRWKLSILISLASGQRFKEALKMLDQFPVEKRSPAVQIRYLDLIAKRSIEAGDETTCRRVSSQIWKHLKGLESDDPLRLLQSVKLLQHAMKFSSMNSTRSLIESIESLLENPSLLKALEPEDYLNSLLKLGKASIQTRQFDRAANWLQAARVQLEKIDDDLFDRETESSKLELAFADLYAKKGDAQKSKLHAESALTLLTQMDDSKLQSQAKALDGGQGFFSDVLRYNSGSSFVDLILWHENEGNHQQVKQIWSQMPLSYQKLTCQIKLAEMRVKSSQSSTAVDCAKMCLDLIDDQTPVGDQLSIKIAAAIIFQKCKQLKQRDKLIDQLINEELILDSDELTATLANELTELELFQKAYELTQRIETIALRAGPLARIATKGAVLHPQ